MSTRHPRCCVVPPHMLEKISENGTPDERRAALSTLALSERFRARRQMLAALPLLTLAGDKRRTIYDAHHSTSLPGTRVRSEGDAPAADPATNEAYDGAGATYDLYLDVYARNSIDGRGMRLDSTVHYGSGYDNAFWNGTQMVYGDGDGKLFKRFTISVDVIGHELTHGITERTAGLEYSYQPGALNESISDVFGSLVKQRSLNQEAGEADWLIGEGILVPSLGAALRSMKAPGTAMEHDPQPADMQHYVELPDDGVPAHDNGGVHINSGIPNHAFYLAATSIGGYAWDKAGKIWYQTLTEGHLKPDSEFKDAANATVGVAGELFGAGSSEHAAVEDAWQQVGVLR